MIISARFTSKCPDCGARIQFGQKVNWSRGQKAACLGCKTSASVPSGQALAYQKRRNDGYSRAGASQYADGELRAERAEQARMNAEYAAGVNDYETWKFDTMIGGEQYAAAEEYARYLRFGDDY